MPSETPAATVAAAARAASPRTPLRYLVTGAAGFIGSHTAEALLRRGECVIAVDEMNDYYSLNQKQHNIDVLMQTAASTGAELRFYRGSCEDEELMRGIFTSERIDRVCHLAARAGVRPSIKNPHMYIQANVTATVTLLELAREFGVDNFVYASSSSVYGQNAKVPFAESDRTDAPVSPYAATKKSCELMAATYNHLYGLPTIGLRFFTVYGPRGRPDMAPFMFVDRIASGKPINKFGDGSSCRDYTFIDDIVAGVLAALDSPRPKAAVFNLGNSATVSLNEFIAAIEEIVGRRAIINQMPDQPGDVPRTFADLTLASKELGYRPTTSIRDGMRKFFAWYATEYQQIKQRDEAPISPPSPPLSSHDSDFAVPMDISVSSASSVSAASAEPDRPVAAAATAAAASA